MGIKVELRKRPDGTLRQNWYGVHVANGKRRVASLNLWRGNPPASLLASDLGDAEFERSRGVAQDMARKVFAADTDAADKAALARTFYRNRYRQDVKVHLLADLPTLWTEIPKKREPTPFHAHNMALYLRRFVDFMANRHPGVRELPAVQPEHIRAYVKALPGIAGEGRSCNEHLMVLRRVFKFAAPESVGAATLATTPGFDKHTVHKVPFKPEQLPRIFEEAKADPFIYPMIVCAACTAMRRKDVALLRWRSVNLRDRFIRVTAAKTGTTCEIPIFPALLPVLEAARGTAKREPAPDAFVWPDAAKLYLSNPDGLDLHLERVLERAGFMRPEDAQGRPVQGVTVQEKAAGSARKKRANLIGWHSFKTTWVTLALSAGVPREIVMAVTGNQAVEVVLKHYFRPDRETMRATLVNVMPAQLTAK